MKALNSFELLFYNLNLRCYVVIELKIGEFKSEYAGQLNFCLSAVDGILKKDADNPAICRRSLAGNLDFSLRRNV